MRTETTTTTYYLIDELDEQARERAVDNLAQREAEFFEPEPIAEVIVWTLAEKLQSPGWDRYGCGDFPGIDGVSIVEWDIDRLSIGAQGYLTRETAPALPWGRYTAYYFGGRSTVAYAVVEPDEDGYEEEVGRWHGFDDGERHAEFDELDQAIRDALHDAVVAGRDEWEYRTSEEALVEMAEINEWEFHEDGRLA